MPVWNILRAMHHQIVLQAYPATAVAGAWLILLLAGWWRPEPSWIDRLGRVLGLGWIVLSLSLAGAPLLGRW
jgi:hypothetical protein